MSARVPRPAAPSRGDGSLRAGHAGQEARAGGRSLLPWIPLAVAAALGVAALGLEAIDPRGGSPMDPVLVPILATYALLGGLIVSRRRGNVVGWLVSLLGVSMIGSFYLARYAVVAVDGALALPGGEVAGAFGWTWVVALACPVFIAFLVPTGRPASPGWGVVLRAVAATFALVVLAFALGSPDSQLSSSGTRGVVPNPLYVPALRPLYEAVNAAFVIYLGLFGLGAAALVARFRRSAGVERVQLKWVLWGIAAMLVFIAASNTLPVPAGDVAFALAMIPLPVAIAVAILRHRLYDIDRIISRTFSYAIVTGLLAALFAGLVVGLEQALAPVTQSNGLAVAASTLVVAATFAPLRRRVQAVVDRRFDRAGVDAERAAAAFAARLRDETDLDRVSGEVEHAVRWALAPASMSVWTRDR